MKNYGKIGLVVAGLIFALGSSFYLGATVSGDTLSASVFNATKTIPSIWVHVRDNGGNCWDESWEYNGATNSWELAARTTPYRCATRANPGSFGDLLVKPTSSAPSTVGDTGSAVSVFSLPKLDEITKIQNSLVKSGVLKKGEFTPGKMNLATMKAILGIK